LLNQPISHSLTLYLSVSVCPGVGLWVGRSRHRVLCVQCAGAVS